MVGASILEKSEGGKREGNVIHVTKTEGTI